MRREQFEELARRVVPGRGEVRLEPLTAGLVNETFRVWRAGRACSRRAPAAGAGAADVDREWERRVLADAAAAGLAPPAEYCDPDSGVLLLRWATGRAWTAAEVRQPANIARIARLARRIHALPVPRPTRAVGPAGWIAHYLDALEARGAPPGVRAAIAPAAVESRLAALAALPPGGATLCHGDLHPHNLVVEGERAWLLDWEYAHVSQPLWDLAGWLANNDLGEDLATPLLAAYLGREPAPGERARLELLAWLYDYVCVLWSDLHLRSSTGGEAAAIAASARRRAARIAAAPVVAAGRFRHTS